jgi:hypothetical protein
LVSSRHGQNVLDYQANGRLVGGPEGVPLLHVGVGRQQIPGLRPRNLHDSWSFRVEPDNGDAVGDRTADDLRCAACSRRIFAVPDGDEQIDIRQHDKARRLIGPPALIGGAVELEYRGGGHQQLLECRPRFRRGKIAGILGAGKRQHSFERITRC